MSPSSRRGLACPEILVAAAILAFASLPILGMLSEENVKAHFNEYHLHARRQARWAADALQVMDYDHLAARAAAAGGAPADLPGLDGRRLREIGDPVPPAPESYGPYIEQGAGQAPFLRHAIDRAAGYERRCFFGEAAPGLGEIVVLVRWRLPTDRPGIRHHYLCRRLVARPETSWSANEPIRSE